MLCAITPFFPGPANKVLLWEMSMCFYFLRSPTVEEFMAKFKKYFQILGKNSYRPTIGGWQCHHSKNILTTPIYFPMDCSVSVFYAVGELHLLLLLRDPFQQDSRGFMHLAAPFPKVTQLTTRWNHQWPQYLKFLPLLWNKRSSVVIPLRLSHSSWIWH